MTSYATQYISSYHTASVLSVLNNPPGGSLVIMRLLTIILLVQALEDQPEFLLVVSEIMNKLLKV